MNNAGTAVYASILDTTLAERDEVLAVNLRGAFLLSKSLFPARKASAGGAIVNISSVHAEATSVGIAHRNQVTVAAGSVRYLCELRPDRQAFAEILLDAGFARVETVPPGTSLYFESGEKTLMIASRADGSD